MQAENAQKDDNYFLAPIFRGNTDKTKQAVRGDIIDELPDGEILLDAIFAKRIDKLALPYVTLKDIIENLEEWLEDTNYRNIDEWSFGLMFKVTYKSKMTRTITIAVGNLTWLLKEIKRWAREMFVKIVNSDTDIDEEEDILDQQIANASILVFDRNYGYGRKAEFYISHDGVIYNIWIPESRTRCLLHCVAKATNTPIETITSRMRRVDENYMEYVQENYNINYDWKNYNREAINIYMEGNHAGLVTRVEPSEAQNYYVTLPETKYFEQNVKHLEPDNLVLVAIDFEFGWETTQIPTLKKATEPLIGSLVYKEGINGDLKWMIAKKAKGRMPVVQHIISELKTLASKYKGKNILCYSHNGRGVEHIILNRALLETNNGTNQYITNVEGTKIKSFKIGNIFFIDSQLLFSAALKAFCKAMRVENKDDIVAVMKEKGYWKEEDGPFMEVNQWMSGPKEKDKIECDYCLQDSKALLQALTKFNETVIQTMNEVGIDKTGKWVLCRPGMAGIAFSMLTTKYKIATTPENLKSYIFPAYLGGRNEIFRTGNWKTDEDYTLYSQDINSSYPNQMRTIANNITNVQFFPTNYDYKNRKNWLAKCTIIHTPKIPIGKIGIRTNDTIVFPTGTFEAWIFDFEYDETIEILGIECIIEYDTIDVSEYTLTLYNRRLAVGKKEPLGETMKLTLNMGYGRLALKQLRTTTCLVQDVKEFIDKFHIALTYGQNTIYVDKAIAKLKERPWFNLNMEELHDADVNYVAAAKITAGARLYLYNKYVELYNQGCKIIYSDTDSVYYLRPNGLPKPINETGLGGWDAEELKEITVKGLKVYSYIDMEGKEVFKYKGVHKPTSLDARQDLTVWCRKSLELYTSDITKESTFEYRKGVINQDTNEVHPIHL